ncbi:hypothetical protein BFS30_24760 [Pedobacter steynii]|uniref:Por secretion system C-terminal sorting domain-containing protein n=2 Tax=Pedobacter steynii TaxID=430522 RepID=A0A1D7QN79_9SPHI|nr:hypothetical protein BFS30_24760 [Pedobacter steynii]
MAVSSGFNADVIANGIGTSISTTNNDVDGANYSFVSAGWQFNAANAPLANGLPANGLITSPITTGLTYQLADYSSNNCLRINNAAAGTLSFISQIKAQNVYVLVTSGSGNCTITAQVNFTDATNQQFTGLAVNDWFGGNPYEIGQIRRILRNATTTVPETSTTGPRLYRQVLAISAANQNKQIASIQFTRTSGTGVLNVFAVSFESVVTCAAPTAPIVSALTSTTATLNWTQTGTPLQWQIKYGAPGFNPATTGTSVFTTIRPYTLNPPLTPVTAYSYYVRAVCGVNDTSAWSPVNNFTTPPVPINSVPMVIPSGFNADVIANGIGTTIATTNNDVDGANYSFLSTGWQFNASGAPAVNALPANGEIISPITPGLTYQLADYSSNNSLRINNATTGTLTFASQIKAQNIYILATSGSGNCTITAQVNFMDATNQQFAGLAISDWFGGAPFEIGQIGRILRNTTSTAAETSATGPRLYRQVLAISASNQNKQIASIQFTRTSGTGVLNVFAVSFESMITCAAPTGPIASALTPTTATLNWTQTGTPLQWQIKYGAPGFNPATAGTSVFTVTKPYTLNAPLAPFTAYSYYVRAVCGPNDTSVWSQVTNFTTPCMIPAILSKADSYHCGPGTVVLQATASAGGGIKWYSALTGGTALATGNSFTTPSLTTTTTYYISAFSGSCESTPRQAVIAGIRPVPVVHIGNDTTICPGITYSMDAGNPGASYSWNTGATTQVVTVSAPGSYSVQVMLNGCNNAAARMITAGITPQNNLPALLDLCAGNIATLDAGNTGSSFLWTPGGETTQTINVTTGGLKSVAITSATGCVINSNTDVALRPLPVVNLGNDTAFCRGNSLVLDAGNTGASFLWNTGAISQTIIVDTTGNYAVLVTDNYDCKGRDSIGIVVKATPSGTINAIYGDTATYTFNVINPRFVSNYTWDFGDGSPLASGPQVQHRYNRNGIFTVTVKLSGDCKDSLVQSRTVDVFDGQGTGIVSHGQSADLLLYPNPARAQISIGTRNNAWKPELYRITNVFGVTLLTGKFSGNTQQISVASLVPGIYFMHVVTDKGFVNRKFEVLK